MYTRLPPPFVDKKVSGKSKKHIISLQAVAMNFSSHWSQKSIQKNAYSTHT